MTGLIGWWPLHEDLGSTAQDLSGNGNHGSLSGGVVQGVAGKGGLTAYGFDGSDDSVSANVSLDSQVTVSLWVRLHDISSRKGIFFHGTSNNGADLWLEAHDNSGDGNYDDLRLLTNDGNNGSSTYADSVFEPKRWYHVVAIVEDQNQEVYLNNSNVLSTSMPWAQRDTYTYVGNWAPNASRPFDGSICDVRMYQRKLSTQEIQTLYEWGSGDYTTRSLSDGSDSGAVSRWKLDLSADDAWSGNDGVINSSVSEVSPAIRNGGMKFNGSDGYNNDGTISLPNGTFEHLDGSNPWTMSFWMRLDSDKRHIILSCLGDYEIDFLYDWDGDEKLSVSGSGTKVKSNSSLPQNWVHTTFTHDGVDNLRIYINGVLDNEGTLSSWNSRDGEESRLGGRSTGSDKKYNGDLDDIRLYNRALSPSEVFQLYQWGTRGRDMRKLTVNKR